MVKLTGGLCVAAYPNVGLQSLAVAFNIDVLDPVLLNHFGGSIAEQLRVGIKLKCCPLTAAVDDILNFG